MLEATAVAGVGQSRTLSSSGAPVKTIGRKLSEVLDFSNSTLRAAPVDFQVPVINGGKRLENGPLPMTSGICMNGSVAASRAGMITGAGWALDRKAGSVGNGLCRRQTIVRSSLASIAATSFCALAALLR